MKAFIQYNDRNIPFGINAYTAEDWFLQMGWEVVPFRHLSDVENQLSKEYPVVGSINNVLLALDKLGVKRPLPLEIPECLVGFGKRKIWTSTLGEVRNNEALWPVFVKPLEEHKLFTGHVLRVFTDLYKSMAFEDSTKVLVSETVNFLSEYRCFVLNGKILDVRRYCGSLDWYPDLTVVQDIIKAFLEEAPVAYSVDVGSVDGQTVLVEINDSYALGTYGLPAHLQVKMIVSRWKEMVK